MTILIKADEARSMTDEAMANFAKFDTERYIRHINDMIKVATQRGHTYTMIDVYSVEEEKEKDDNPFIWASRPQIDVVINLLKEAGYEAEYYFGNVKITWTPIVKTNKPWWRF